MVFMCKRNKFMNAYNYVEKIRARRNLTQRQQKSNDSIIKRVKIIVISFENT